MVLPVPSHCSLLLPSGRFGATRAMLQAERRGSSARPDSCPVGCPAIADLATTMPDSGRCESELEQPVDTGCEDFTSAPCQINASATPSLRGNRPLPPQAAALKWGVGPARHPEGTPPFKRKLATFSTSRQRLRTSLAPQTSGQTGAGFPAGWADEDPLRCARRT